MEEANTEAVEEQVLAMAVDLEVTGVKQGEVAKAAAVR